MQQNENIYQPAFTCPPNTGQPLPQTLEQLADLPLNLPTNIPSTCAWTLYVPSKHESVLKERGFNYPSNGEFAYSKGAPCFQCTELPGCGSGSGCPFSIIGPVVDGQRAALTRTNYLGQAQQCCVTQKKTSGIYTCAPEYRNNASKECRPVMSAYCSDTVRYWIPLS